ncbi:MAG: hypothetical protein ACR2QH_15195 [Geminicoccaceae bacterium]
MLTADELEKALLDVINWAAGEGVNKTEIANVSGLTRPTVYKASEPGWDPSISTIMRLAIARETIHNRSTVKPDKT